MPQSQDYHGAYIYVARILLFEEGRACWTWNEDGVVMRLAPGLL
jgi:hypothetical protein